MEELYKWLATNYQWLITTILSGIAAAAALWRWAIIPHFKKNEDRRRQILKELEKERTALLSLRDVLMGRSEIVRTEYYFEKDQMQVLPPADLSYEGKEEIEANYNRRIEELSSMLFSARNSVKNVVARCVEKHLGGINSTPEPSVGDWILGDCRDHTLSKVMADALEAPIMRGHRVDKPLLDSIDPDFYEQMRKVLHKRNGDFKAFLVNVNSEIDAERKRGILKSISEKRTVIIEYLDKTMDEAEKRIDEIGRLIDKNTKQKK